MDSSPISAIYTRYDAQVIETEGHAGDAGWPARHEAEVVARFKSVPPVDSNLNGIDSNWDSASGPQAFEATKVSNLDLIQWERGWVRQYRAMMQVHAPV